MALSLPLRLGFARLVEEAGLRLGARDDSPLDGLNGRGVKEKVVVMVVLLLSPPL